MSTATTDIATRRNGTPGAALAVRPGQDMWDDRQRAALVALGIPKDASSAELAVYMHQCQRTGLDPFTKQIYLIYRRTREGDKWVSKPTTQVGIDGYRVIRDRIAKREGLRVEYEDTIWFDSEGRGNDVWLWDYPPAACRVVVLVDGRRFPSVLKFSEYCQYKDGKPISQWASKPAHMIEKCAEANALRRAFPHDLAGVALEDEMPPEAAPAAPARVTAAGIRARQPVRAEVVRDPEDASPAGPQTPPADPAGEAQDRPPAHASSGQVSMIETEFERLGYDLDSPDDQQAALNRTARLAGVEIASIGQLDQERAKWVHAQLKGCGDIVELDELLESGEKPGAEDA